MFSGLQFKVEHHPDVLAELAPIVDTLTTDDITTDATLKAYETRVTTGGGRAGYSLDLPAGEYVGQRKLITLAVKGHAEDSLSLDVTQVGLFVASPQGPIGAPGGTSITMNTAGQYILIEWGGVCWNIIYVSDDAIVTMPH